MNPPEAFHYETEVFAKALQLPPGERAAFLQGACGHDGDLRRRLEALLRIESRVGSFLEDPGRSSGVSDLLEPAREMPPQRVGRYRLQEKIGEGGCGVIYLAEQAEPVRRSVALKIIKPGMDTRDVIARFKAERQALAMMDHPGIAKVFDAGETESGRPYFVMELIRGVRITDYCDQNSLTVGHRLKLFIQVCEAVQHAHQKGVIHRDLKPANILVTATPEGTAQPVVIDFGIAKATNDLRLSDKTWLTAMEMLVGTPLYMSPEQIAGSGTDVDTRSDIYSLGVLLYELLTGVTPLDAGEWLTRGIDEVRRVLRDREPPRPSTRLSRMTGEQAVHLAQHRRAEPQTLIRALSGDLDWIVMKALEKDRARRYVTANDLASDVKRHLQHEPVYARPPSSAYRLQKAIARNRPAFLAAAAILVVLVAGIITTTRQLLEARAAERVAQAQALAARRIAYSSDMNAVQQALVENNLGRARLLLERQKPLGGELDLRDWEWRYLWSQSRADDHQILAAGPRWSARPVAFSADGSMVARTLDGRTVVTELDSGRVLWDRPGAPLQAFLNRRNWIAYVTREPGTNRDVISIRDLAAGTETPLLQYDHATEWIGYTPDDRILLTVSIRPGTVRTETSLAALTAWEANTGRTLWQRTIIGRPPWMRWRSYAVSPDGSAFAAALPGGRVQVLDTADGRERFTIAVTEELSICVNFSPDSETLLTGAGFSDPVIRLWDAATGEGRGTMRGHSTYVTDLLFTPDGSRLISSGADQMIRLWDWKSRQPSGVFRGHLDEVDGLSMAPDGKTLASRCKDGSIYLWDLNKPSGQLGYQTLPGRLRARPQTTQFTSDSRFIVGIEIDGGIAVWDVESAREVRRLSGVASNKTFGISPDARWIVGISDPHTLTIRDASTGAESFQLRADGPGPGYLDWKFIDNGKRLVTVSGPASDARLETWEPGSWRRMASVGLRYKTLLDYSINFEPKSFTLPDTYVVMGDGAFHLYNLARLDAALRSFRAGFEADDWTGSPDGRWVVSADSSGMVRWWDVATLEPVAMLKSFRLGAHSVVFSSDGRRLAAGSNGREAVRLWDMATRQEVLTLSGEGSRVSGLEFSPDGRHLLAVNDAGLVHIWTAPSWDEIAAQEAGDRAQAKMEGAHATAGILSTPSDHE